MIFSKKIVGNSRNAAAQWAEVTYMRNMCHQHELGYSAQARRFGNLHVNEGSIPIDVWKDFDNVTVEIMHLDDGDAFLNDLLPLSSSVNIGKLTQSFRQASDAGLVQTSMTGQIGVKLDKVDYSFDGAIIPIHDAGFKRNWREWNAQQSEGFDALIDDQRENVRSVREHMADQFMDGHVDTDGNPIVVDSLSWGGMRNDSRVVQVDLGAGDINFDFTDVTKTGDEIKAAFIQIRDIMRITSKCTLDITYYISEEIASNFERKFSANYDADLIEIELARLRGVATIKSTNKLIGNQIMGFPLDRSKIRPIVGMALNTIAMPRPVYNSDYLFVTWTATGFQIREDFAGNSCVFYAEVP